MIDRHGKPVNVGWAIHEKLWVGAALTLRTQKERYAAFQDISSMTGRSFAAVRERASHLATELRLEAALRAFVPNTIMVVAPGANRGWDKRRRLRDG